MQYELLTTLMINILSANEIHTTLLRYPYENYGEMDLGLRTRLLGFENMEQHVIPFYENIQERNLYYFSDIFRCHYAALRLPEQDAILVCGPVVFEQMTPSKLEDLCFSLTLPQEVFLTLQNYYTQIPFLSSKLMFESILTQYSIQLFQKEPEVIRWDSTMLEKYQYNYQTYLNLSNDCFSTIEFIERKYQLENRLLHAVTKGNQQQALKFLQELFMACKNTDGKVFVIDLNAAIRKVIEKSNVHPIYIDGICKSLISVIDSCETEEQYFDLSQKLVQSYCQLVLQQDQTSQSPLIRKILAHIDADLKADLSLKYFASQLNVNPNYLSTLFSKEMDMTLTEYVNHCRMQHAQKLLLGTNDSLKMIAEQCGILDVHYFSKLFKKTTGKSPKMHHNAYCYADKKALNKIKKDSPKEMIDFMKS